MALPRVYFDMTANNAPVGRIVMEVRPVLDVEKVYSQVCRFLLLFPPCWLLSRHFRSRYRVTFLIIIQQFGFLFLNNLVNAFAC